MNANTHSPCPLTKAASVLPPIAVQNELRNAAMRPSELHKAMPGATPRVLDLQLKELVNDGLVAKIIYPELPPRSEYSITELGQSLLTIIDAMIEWGEANRSLFVRKYGQG